MCSQLRHISTIGKKFLSSNPQYGELRPTIGWYRSGSLGHPCKFQRVSRLGSVTARHSSNRRQPNFAVLNRGHHLYSAGRSSRWALAHILVLFFIFAWNFLLELIGKCPNHTLTLTVNLNSINPSSTLLSLTLTLLTLTPTLTHCHTRFCGVFGHSGAPLQFDESARLQWKPEF